MQIVSWNLEDSARWLADDGRAFRAQFAALGSPDVLCVQEIRLRAADEVRIAALRRLLPDHRCELRLPDDPRNVRVRGGRANGVATFVATRLGELAVHAPAWDREGRVLVCELPAPRLAIVNLYAVNGTSAPYLDHDTGAQLGDRHQHKRRLQDHLFGLVDELRARGPVIIAGDWNVSRTALDVHPRLRTEAPHALARAELEAHLASRGLVDVFRHLHPDARAYTWRARWKRPSLDAARVDYIVVPRDLLDDVTAAVVLDDPALRPHSDHAPVRIELRARP